MASTELKWNLPQTRSLVCSLMVLLCLHTVTGMSGWGGCLEGQDIFASVRENGLPGEVVAELMTDTTMEGVRWSLDGRDADWFLLDGRNIRLNTSAEKVLDREAQGPVLMAEMSCYEEDVLQSVYRIMVEILNVNDNSPVFAENTLQTVVISELTPVNTLVFTVQATDTDNDKIIYSIDQSSPDAEYFKIDLPNSGGMILSKRLDYETKSQLSVTIHASEMRTAEHFNTSTNVSILVQDGDDQYPQFLPCTLLFQDETSRICANPVYTVNITEGEEDVVLDFSPGPIQAVDGDAGLRSPISYAILSGDDDGHFLIDRETGEVRLTRAVSDRLTTLQVTAYQDDDPRKYSVATVLVRVVAVNQFHPEFNMAEYHGFVTAGKNLASLVNTYGSKALMLHVLDQDFKHGFNPMIHFTLSPTSNHTDIYQVTQGGLLIARTNHLKPKQKHVLEVMAVDQESGDAASAVVVVEVLSEGQSIPHSPLGDERLIGCTVGKALFLSTVFMTVVGCILYVVMWLKKKHKVQRNPLERGCVAQGKHPNVSLRWFQLVSHRSAMPQMDDIPVSNEEHGTCNPSFSFQDEAGMYPHQDLRPRHVPAPPSTAIAPDSTSTLTGLACSPAAFYNNVSSPAKSLSRSPTYHLASVEESSSPHAAPPTENLNSQTPPPDTTLDPTELLPNTSSVPDTLDATVSPPFACLDSQTNPSDEPADTAASASLHSSPCIVPCSHTQTDSAEKDKAHVIASPNRSSSLLPASPLPKQMGTPPSSPDDIPLKAKLVHIDKSPPETPPATPKPTSMNLDNEDDEPSTSLDQLDQLEHPGGEAGSPSQDRRPSTNSGNTQDGREDDDGFLGNEGAGKNSESDSELEPDEEELLRVMAICNPTFITFRK